MTQHLIKVYQYLGSVFALSPHTSRGLMLTCPLTHASVISLRAFSRSHRNERAKKNRPAR
jgi:hypothetical protein